MKKGEPLFRLDVPNETKRTMRFAKELPDRMEAFKKGLLYILVTEINEGLMAKLPKSSQHKHIRDNLEIAELQGRIGFSIHVKSSGKKIKKLDASKTVLYIRSKSGGKAPENIKILEDMGPWTVETIPFWPDKKNALVVQRKVRTAEVERITKMQVAQAAKVRRALAQAGFPQTAKKKSESGKIPKNAKAVPDVAMAALSLEFGSGGQKSVPAWRISVMEALSTGLRRAPLRNRNMKDLLTNPTSTRWKRWPRVKNKMKGSEAKQFKDFMRKVGL